MKKRIILSGALVLALSLTTVAYAFSGTQSILIPHRAPQASARAQKAASATPSKDAPKELEQTVAILNQKIYSNEIYIVPLAVFEDAGAIQVRVAYMNKDAGMELATVLVGNETDFADKRIIMSKVTPDQATTGGYTFTFQVKGAPSALATK